MAQAMFTIHNSGIKPKRQLISAAKAEKEAIHSGQFMVSHFVADEQDEEDDVSVAVLEEHDANTKIIVPKVPIYNTIKEKQITVVSKQQPVCIEHSLSKLFKCMSLAYRQKLTSPKWNRFRGIRLRWKEKIRLNNVIWRCWHMQFIKRENTLICQFASPFDSDTHNKPEAVVLEGKYWKRKLAAVTAEYKKCRMFYRNMLPGPKENTSDVLTDLDLATWDSHSNDMLVDEDYMELMTDTLFSTIANQHFQFPDSREIAKAGLADFIQPSLGPLQPNLDDFYMDTFDAYQQVFSGKLTTVPEQPEYYQEQGFLQSYASDSNLLANNASIHQPSIMATMHPLKHDLTPPQQQQYTMLMDTTFRLQAPPTYQPLQPSQQTNIQPAQTQEIHAQQTGLNQHLQENQQQMKQRKVERQRTTSLQSDNYYTKGYQNYDNMTAGNEYGSSNEHEHVNQLNYKQPNQITTPDTNPSSIGYKFAAPMAPHTKFPISQNSNNFKMPARQLSAPMLLNRTATHAEVPVQPEPAKTGRPRGRPRSRSNTREVVKKQPLLSATSDPALVTPQSGNFLLAQLLTTNSEGTNAYNQSQRNANNSNLRIKEESAPIPILPHPVAATLVITANVGSNSHHSEPLLLNTCVTAPDVTSQCLHSPTSSHSSSIGSPSRELHRDIRRAGHIHAEQKRRYNIKNGFDMMHSLIPHLNQNPNAKLSKAAMLQKGAEYIRQLRAERCQLKDEMDSLKQQIDSLNASISNCQSLLPATGAPVSRRQDNKMQEMFEQYVRRRTMEDWRFWIFSLVFRPLLQSYNNFVSTSSLDDLYRTTIVWIEQHCTLVDLRPVVLNSLRYLCTKTDILADPDKLPSEAREAALTSSSPAQSSAANNTKQL